MQARLIAYPPDAAALTRWIAPGERLRIGRASECELHLDHPSVSRHHAELHHEADAWHLHDLDSKNGSFVDGIAISDHPVPLDCWLRFGDVHCQFLKFDTEQVAQLRVREQQRHHLSAVITRRVAGQTQFDSLLDEVLRGVVDLASCSRGFLLLADGDDYLVSASLVIDAKALDRRSFSGSVGAVQRVLSRGKPVVVNQIDRETWLAERASIVGSDLQTLVCLPLHDGERVFGAVYADRSGPGEPITDFDLELLEAFAETASLGLLARRALQKLDDAPRWSTIVHAQAESAFRPPGGSR